MTIEEQTRQVFANIFNILAEAGLTKEAIVRVTVFVSTAEHWGKINAIYTELFEGHKPARGVIPVGPLHFGYDIEVEVTAAR